MITATLIIKRIGFDYQVAIVTNTYCFYTIHIQTPACLPVYTMYSK